MDETYKDRKIVAAKDLMTEKFWKHQFSTFILCYNNCRHHTLIMPRLNLKGDSAPNDINGDQSITWGNYHASRLCFS